MARCRHLPAVYSAVYAVPWFLQFFQQSARASDADKTLAAVGKKRLDPEAVAVMAELASLSVLCGSTWGFHGCSCTSSGNGSV